MAGAPSAEENFLKDIGNSFQTQRHNFAAPNYMVITKIYFNTQCNVLIPERFMCMQIARKAYPFDASSISTFAASEDYADEPLVRSGPRITAASQITDRISEGISHLGRLRNANSGSCGTAPTVSSRISEASSFRTLLAFRLRDRVLQVGIAKLPIMEIVDRNSGNAILLHFFVCVRTAGWTRIVTV